MASNPVNDPYYRLLGTAVGTVVVLQHQGNFSSYTVGTLTTGTVTLFDSSTLAGTAAGNYIASYTGALRDSRPGVYVKRGIVALVSGTVDALIGCG